MIKMKQENYAQKINKMKSILFLNPLSVNKIQLFSNRSIKTKNKRHIEQKGNAVTRGPAASSNYILSIILL
jgi:hypothetical protein